MDTVDMVSVGIIVLVVAPSLLELAVKMWRGARKGPDT